MLGISDLRNTRVFQEAKEEGIEQGIKQGKMAAIPIMLESGISLEKIAQQWDMKLVDVEDLAIASLKNINTPDPDIAQQLNLTLSRVQQVSHK